MELAGVGKKRILFLTGTRADFGKLKPLMLVVDQADNFECLVFVTGMHVLSRYGMTADEVYKKGFRNIHPFINHVCGDPMESILANTINGLSRYVQEYLPDMIVVHGDRVEALAGAIVGALRNILVVHIEGGEISGTIDELIRHSVSKLSHLHFVSNELAANRLRQLGESDGSIYVIGSPDIDVMISKDLPSIEELRTYYEIPFTEYGIALFHPVTTEAQNMPLYAKEFVEALINARHDFVVIYPNNDIGCEAIFTAYKKLESVPHFRIFPSMRFEYFLSLIKHSMYMVGNSSAGIREAPVYAVPSVNIGTRQQNRFEHESIIEVAHDRQSILAGISRACMMEKLKPCHYFGDGNSVARFMDVLNKEVLWQTPKQKQFCDIFLGNIQREGLISEL